MTIASIAPDWYTTHDTALISQKECDLETLQAIVSGVIFRNEDNNYTVMEVDSKGDKFTVVGCLPSLSPGETVMLAGEWDEHPMYGRQLRVSRCDIQMPTTLSGVERYLASGLIRGIGPSTARLIVQEFGKETLDIMTYHPERLLDISGIGPVRYEQITTSFSEQVGSRRTMVFLQTYGISPAMSMKITKQYGEKTETMLRENPYRMIDDIEGIGFLTADRIAQSMGMPQNGDFRLQYGVKYVLQDASSAEGHTYLPRDMLVRRACTLLDATEEIIEMHLRYLLLSRELISFDQAGREVIQLAVFYRIEQEIAVRLYRHLNALPPTRDAGAIRDRIDLFEKAESIRFSEHQREAIEKAARSNLLIITGGPGTGKTTIINCILFVIRNSEETFLAAPTGRAAKRMSEATGHEARTIHRLLEYGGESGQFHYDDDNPLDCKCLIIDEASMIDVFLMRSLMRAVNTETQLIFVGDADQLPSVGPGNVLGDMIFSGIIPQVRLTEIFRQESQSMIILNAHRINKGEMPLLNRKKSDFFLERTDNAAEAAKTIVELCSHRLPGFLGIDEGPQSIQVLSPTKKGLCGVVNLNHLLQSALNPPKIGVDEIRYINTVFREGDKVIHTRNNYHLAWSAQSGEEGEGVFNGDIGYVAQVNEEAKSLAVIYDDNREVVYDYKQLEDLELAYCLSVHKSQGSEFPVVVMPVVGGPPMLLTRNLFYTAMTRARKLVVLVGFSRAIESMVSNDQIAGRFTSLCESLASLKGIYS